MKMDAVRFQELVLAEFGKMNKQFEKIDQRFDKIDGELIDIKNKQVEHDVKLQSIEVKQNEHDIRFDSIDRNLDIVARWTKQLVDNENEVADLIGRRKSVKAF